MELATERRDAETARAHALAEERHAKAVLERVSALCTLARDARILDVGCAQGLFLIACARLGYDVVGVEPNAEAREIARALARGWSNDLLIVPGRAEALPLEPERFDFVHAKSVIEHVDDAEIAFAEAYRVLRAGGVFWFNTASSMCPIQCEIRGFPAFGWYPDRLKRRIMTWAARHRPELIGHTTRPAYHWFTPRKARRMLRAAGFRAVYDRWDLRQPDEGGRAYRLALSVIRSHAITKLLADVVVPGCSYAAVK